MTNTGEGARTRILFVCTANRCRSPFAAALTSRLVGPDIVVSSAGLLPGGARMPSEGVDLGFELGLDFRSHLSRPISDDDLEEADLVIGFSREHLREVVSVAPRVWPRAFTVKQLARWTASRSRPGEIPLRAWLSAEADDRDRLEMIGRSRDDDTADPMGLRLRAWRRLLAELDDNVPPLVAGLSL